MDTKVQHILWHDPIAYDALDHGPSYLPARKTLKQASVGSPLVSLIADLQAASLIHHSHHWNSQGASSYSDHLLYMRLYEESQEAIDQVAEKALGIREVEAIDCVTLAVAMADVVARLHVAEGISLGERSLATELYVVERVKATISALEERGTLTPGVSNLLEGIADKHETFVYLLQQRVGYSYDRSNV